MVTGTNFGRKEPPPVPDDIPRSSDLCPLHEWKFLCQTQDKDVFFCEKCLWKHEAIASIRPLPVIDTQKRIHDFSTGG